MAKRNKDFVDLLDIDAEYKRYEALAVWIANKIRSAMGNSLPQHITEEIINTAKYSLIVSLNSYNEHFNDRSLRKIRLKNYIIYRLYDDINRWWLSTYVGCKSILTQQKYRLYPHSLDDMQLDKQKNGSKNNLLDEPISYESPSDNLTKQDDLEEAKRKVKQIKEDFKLPQYQMDVMLLCYQDYKLKHPGRLTKKRHDNLRQILIKKIKEKYEGINAS